MGDKNQIRLSNGLARGSSTYYQFLDWTDKLGRKIKKFAQCLLYKPLRFAISRAIALSLFSILIAWPVWAATYYVKAGGNDSADGLSDATAWATIPKVQSTVTSGDTVYFRSQDTWTSAMPPTLTATAGVTYDGSAYGSGPRAKLTTTGNYRNDPQGVVRINASNVTFKGFEIDGNQQRLGGIYVGWSIAADISGVNIDNCVVHNTGGISGDWNYGIQIGGKSGSGLTVRNTTVTNCEVYHTFHEGIAIYPSWNTTDNRVDGVLIRGCYVHETGSNDGAGVGVAINNNSKNVTIEHCTLDGNYGYGIDIRTSPTYEGGSTVLAAPAGVVVRYNVISNNTWYGVHVRNPLSFAITCSFYGNLFVGNGKANSQLTAMDFLIQSDPSWSYPNSIFNLYNNTFYSVSNPDTNTNGRAVIAIGYFGGGVGFDTAKISIKNNIIYSGNCYAIFNNRATLTHSNNLIYRSSGSSAIHVSSNGTVYNRAGVLTWEPSAQNTEPKFTGGTLPTGFTGTYGKNLIPNTSYFAITSGNALNNGVTLESPYNGCINGAGLANPVTRPQGAAYDIGAYEFVESMLSSSISPVAPKNFKYQ